MPIFIIKPQEITQRYPVRQTLFSTGKSVTVTEVCEGRLAQPAQEQIKRNYNAPVTGNEDPFCYAIVPGPDGNPIIRYACWDKKTNSQE